MGWLIAGVIVYLVYNIEQESTTSTDEIAEYATLGAFVFVLQSVPIPLQVIIQIPILFTLSGVPLVIVVKGVKKGLLISSSAIILNHLLIPFPPAISVLGVNLANALIAGVTVGILPSYFYKKLGRRTRYLMAFITGLTFVLVEGILIAIELSLSHELNVGNDLVILVEGFILLLLILGILEGFFTAIASSYYFRVKHQEVVYLTDEDSQIDEEEDQIDPILFIDDEE